MKKLLLALSLLCISACAPTAQNVEIKTYSNETYGIAFDYPADATISEDFSQGTVATWDIMVLKPKETEDLDTVIVRVYEKEKIGDMFTEWNDESIVKNDSLLVQVIGTPRSDQAIFRTVKTTFKFTH